MLLQGEVRVVLYTVTEEMFAYPIDLAFITESTGSQG